jgi:hypothetical protein
MLEALKRNHGDVDASAIQALYQVDNQAVAEEIVARALMLRRLRSGYESRAASFDQSVEDRFQVKCS